MTFVTRSLAALCCLLLGLPGCASERERAAWTDYEAVNATFRPAGEAPAAITSAMTLSDYVELAVARSPKIQAQVQRWRAGLERVPQARSLPDPQVTYGGFLEEVETRTGPQLLFCPFAIAQSAAASKRLIVDDNCKVVCWEPVGFENYKIVNF